MVVADNCTDDTAAVAMAHGAQVFHTQGNTHRKAGALNQAIAWMLPHLDDRDLLLVQDADTVLNPWFAETALATFNRKVGAVGGVFYGEEGGGFLGLLQRMEFHRYAWELERTGGKAQVLTGTGTMFRARVLREVRAARRAGVIGGGASYYSLASLTEDDEMTKAVKTLGYRAMSPAAARSPPRSCPPWASCGTSACAGSAVPWRTCATTAGPGSPPATSSSSS